MGAGQGKSRRTQIVSAGAKTQIAAAGAKTVLALPVLDDKKWEQFVHSSELETVNVYQYYLGRNDLPRYNNDEHRKVAKELFEDAVAVGALNLPSSYNVDDFEFIKVRTNTWDTQMKIVLKNEPDLFVSHGNNLWSSIGPTNNMVNGNVLYYLRQIWYAVDILLKAHK